MFFEYGLFFLIGKLAGIWHHVDDFGRLYVINPGPFYLIGRATTAAFSVGTVLLTYMIAKLLTDRKGALISALMLAVSLGHVMVSKDVKADTPCMFFTLVGVYFLMSYLKHRKTSSVIFSAIFAGVGAATKYYSTILLIPLAIAIILSSSIRNSTILVKKLIHMILCIVLFYSAFFICSPYNLIDDLGRQFTFKMPLSLTTKISEIINIKHENDELCEKTLTTQKGTKDAISKLLPNTLNYFYKLYKGLGLVIFIMSIIGFVFIFFNLSLEYTIFLLFPTIFILLSSVVQDKGVDIRHQIVVYPFFITAAGILFSKIINRVSSPKTYVCLLLVLLLFPLSNVISYNIGVSRKDTRSLAKDWIEENIPSETKILIDENGPQLLMNKRRILHMLDKAEKVDGKGQFTAHYDTYLKYQLLGAEGNVTYDLHYIRFPWWREKEVKGGVHELTSDYDRDMGNPLKPVVY